MLFELLDRGTSSVAVGGTGGLPLPTPPSSSLLGQMHLEPAREWPPAPCRFGSYISEV